MARSEGKLDWIIRVLVGATSVAVALAVGIDSEIGILLVVLGAVMLVTAAVGSCPLDRRPSQRQHTSVR